MGLRILWVSAPMWLPTGYGVQAKRTVPALLKIPEVENIALGCYSDLKVGTITYNGIVHLPAEASVAAPLDTLAEAMRATGSDVCISLVDTWLMSVGFASGRIPWVPIVPVDSSPLAIADRRQLAGAFKIVAMSKFGKYVINEAGYAATYIPHVLDTAVFRPASQPKAELKQMLGFPPDCFLIGLVAASKQTQPVSRKGFPEAIMAFVEFQKRHPEARLYIHCPVWASPEGKDEEADVGAMAQQLGLDWEYAKMLDRFTYRVGVPEEILSQIYSAFDVYFAPSAGEGFGLPLVEAQSCGVPAVANGNSAQVENLGAGWLVEPIAPAMTGLASFWYPASPTGWDCPCGCGYHREGLVDALEKAYVELQDPEQRKKLSHKAQKFAKQFQIETVVDQYWRPFLAELADDLARAKVRGSLWQPGQDQQPPPDAEAPRKRASRTQIPPRGAEEAEKAPLPLRPPPA